MGPTEFEMKMEAAAKLQTAATLAAALIVASGRPHSPNEAKAVLDEVYHVMFPNPNAGSYQIWQREGKPHQPHK